MQFRNEIDWWDCGIVIVVHFDQSAMHYKFHYKFMWHLPRLYGLTPGHRATGMFRQWYSRIGYWRLTASAGRRVALLVDIDTATVRIELNRGGFLGLRINQTSLDISTIQNDTLAVYLPMSRENKNGIRSVPGQCEKCLLHTFVCLCTSLQEPQSKLVGKRTPLLNCDRSLLLPVALVTDKDLVDAGRRMLFNVGKPSSDVYQIWFSVQVQKRSWIDRWAVGRKDNSLLKDFSSVTS